MRTVIKIIFAVGLLGAARTGAAAPTETHFFTTRTLLGDLFPHSERVTYRTVKLEGAVRVRVAQRLGYQPARPEYTVFVASTGAHIDGYAIIDEEPGQHLPITFATMLSPRGVVERVEIVTYREPRGDEVRDARFRRQFVGKTGHDAIRVSRDIDAVSGATISSASMATGVRRAVVLVEETMLGLSTFASAGPAPGRTP